MSLNRIYALMLRQWYATLRSLDKLTDAFYWVTLDLALWGVTAHYVQTTSSMVGNIFFMIVASVILWTVIYRGSSDVAMSMLDELWNRNLINLFAAPVSITEWVISCACFGLIKAAVAALFGAAVGFLFYRLNIFVLSWHILPMFLLLFLTGWALGLSMAGFIMIFTTKVQALAWTAIWLIAPFSAVYFPLDSLPVWAQVIGKFLPTSYIFEEMRSLIQFNTISYQQLSIALLLNVIYLLISIFVLKRCFAKALDRGLAKIY